MNRGRGNDNEFLNCEWCEPILPYCGAWITCCRTLLGMTECSSIFCRELSRTTCTCMISLYSFYLEKGFPSFNLHCRAVKCHRIAQSGWATWRMVDRLTSKARDFSPLQDVQTGYGASPTSMATLFEGACLNYVKISKKSYPMPPCLWEFWRVK